LEVYSSMAVYQEGPSTDRFQSLYATAKTIPGVKYVGSLPQPDLASALSKAHVLSYPNTFAETSCISVMEALAAGLFVVTSELGALRESSLGLARFVSFGGAGDINGYVVRYRDALAETIGSYSVIDWADRLYNQVTAVNRTCTWGVRALEWTQ